MKSCGITVTNLVNKQEVDILTITSRMPKVWRANRFSKLVEQLTKVGSIKVIKYPDYDEISFRNDTEKGVIYIWSEI